MRTFGPDWSRKEYKKCDAFFGPMCAVVPYSKGMSFVTRILNNPNTVHTLEFGYSDTHLYEHAKFRAAFMKETCAPQVVIANVCSQSLDVVLEKMDQPASTITALLGLLVDRVTHTQLRRILKMPKLESLGFRWETGIAGDRYILNNGEMDILETHLAASNITAFTINYPSVGLMEDIVKSKIHTLKVRVGSVIPDPALFCDQLERSKVTDLTIYFDDMFGSWGEYLKTQNLTSLGFGVRYSYGYNVYENVQNAIQGTWMPGNRIKTLNLKQMTQSHRLEGLVEFAIQSKHSRIETLYLDRASHLLMSALASRQCRVERVILPLEPQHNWDRAQIIMVIKRRQSFVKLITAVISGREIDRLGLRSYTRLLPTELWMTLGDMLFI